MVNRRHAAEWSSNLCEEQPGTRLVQCSLPHCSTHCIIWASGEKIDQMAAQTQIGSRPQDAERLPICSPCVLNPQLCPPCWESWQQLASCCERRKEQFITKGPLNQSSNPLLRSGNRGGLGVLSCPHSCYLCILTTFGRAGRRCLVFISGSNFKKSEIRMFYFL